MKIGKTIRSYTIEPLANPVPDPTNEDEEREARDLPAVELPVSPTVVVRRLGA